MLEKPPTGLRSRFVKRRLLLMVFCSLFATTLIWDNPIYNNKLWTLLTIIYGWILSLISASFCGAFVVTGERYQFLSILRWNLFPETDLALFWIWLWFYCPFCVFVFLSYWFVDVNSQSWLSIWIVICSSSLFNGILIEANSGQNWSTQLKKKTYQNYENYCRDFVEGIISPYAIC